MDWEILRSQEPVSRAEIDKAHCTKCGSGMLHHIQNHIWYCPNKLCPEYEKLKEVE